LGRTSERQNQKHLNQKSNLALKNNEKRLKRAKGKRFGLSGRSQVRGTFTGKKTEFKKQETKMKPTYTKRDKEAMAGRSRRKKTM